MKNKMIHHDTPRPTMTDEEMVEDYLRLRREYALLHQDYREAILNPLNKLKNLRNWCKRHIKKQEGCYQEGAVYETMDYLEAWGVIDKINELIDEK